MIQVRRIKALSPEWGNVLDERSKAGLEWAAQYKFDVIKNSTAVWLIMTDERPAFFFGVKRGSMLGYGVEMWFMTCKDTPKLLRRTLPFARRGIRRLIRMYGHAKSSVAADFERGQRFVEYFGFSKVGEFDAEDGKHYFLYEQRASWQ